MPFLSSTDLLSVWEEGRDQPPARKALALLAAALPDSGEEIARLSIGRRDTELLRLRQHLFGSSLVALTKCPACEEAVETEMKVADLIGGPSGNLIGTFKFAFDQCEISFRLPNSLDLLALDTDSPPDRAREQLLGRCLIGVRRKGEAVSGGALTAEELGAIGLRMAEADPQGNIELMLNCPACSHHWSEVFDIVSFLWTELHAWAGRLLREVHELASAYGWSEAEILSLNPLRRQTYLDLIRQ